MLTAASECDVSFVCVVSIFSMIHVKPVTVVQDLGVWSASMGHNTDIIDTVVVTEPAQKLLEVVKST